MAGKKKRWTQELEDFVRNIANNAAAGAKALAKALTILAEHGMSWDDLVRDLLANPPPEWKKEGLIEAIDDMGSGNASKRHDAVTKAYDLIRDELKRIEENNPADPPKMPGITLGWRNVVDRFKLPTEPQVPAAPTIRPEVKDAPKIEPLLLFESLVATLKDFVFFSPRTGEHYYVLTIIIAWWTWNWRHFHVVPRVLIDAMFGESGKTALVNFFRKFCANAKVTKRATPASLRNVAAKGYAIFLDEGETMRRLMEDILAIWDGGYELGSDDWRDSGKRDGENAELPMLCPMFLSGVLERLPWMSGQFQRRAFKLFTWRVSKKQRAVLGWSKAIPDINDPKLDHEALGFNRMCLQLEAWALNRKGTDFAQYPVLPEGLTTSGENNTRVLVALADAIHPTVGEWVRAACVFAEANSGNAEDALITALRDMRLMRDLWRGTIKVADFLRANGADDEAIKDAKGMTGHDYLISLIEDEDGNEKKRDAARTLARRLNYEVTYKGEKFCQFTTATVVGFFRAQRHGRWLNFAGRLNRGTPAEINRHTLGRLLGGLVHVRTLWSSPAKPPSGAGYKYHEIERHPAGDLFEMYVDLGEDLEGNDLGGPAQSPKPPTVGLTHRREAIGKRPPKPTRPVSDPDAPITAPPPRRKRGRPVGSKNRRKIRRRRTYKVAAARKRTSGKRTSRKGDKSEAIRALLTRKEGCTTADIKAATSWPTVSVPDTARRLGLRLTQQKQGRSTRYWGAVIY